MIPGKTYVGTLPGHTKPAFVRRKPVDAGRAPFFLTRIFGSSQRAFSVEAPWKLSMFRRRSRRNSSYDYESASYRRRVYAQPPNTYYETRPGRVATSIQQTCASCGKFRSAKWQAAHPLVPGEASKSGLCGKCRYKGTSSEEERPKHRRRQYHHRPREHSDSSEDRCCSRVARRGSRRYTSDSADCRRRSVERSDPRNNVRIIISNQSGDTRSARRESSRSSSMDVVRVIRRTEIVDLPERVRSRSRARSSSHAVYVDRATRYLEDQDRARYHSRPRSLSQTQYTEEIGVPRRQHRARSSSQVRFEDEIDEPVILPRPRSLNRRRAIYFDGPADTDRPASITDIRTPSTGSLIQGAVDTPRSLPRQRAIERSRGAELVEETILLCDRPTSGSTAAEISAQPIPQRRLETNLTKRSDQPDIGPSLEARPNGSKSDHPIAPRLAVRYVHLGEGMDDVQEPIGHHSAYNEINDPEHYGEHFAPPIQYGRPSRKHAITASEASYCKKRRRFQGPDCTSGSEDDDWDRPLPSPISYCYARPQDPPVTHPDILAEMLQSAQITPPGGPSGAQYASGRPSRRPYNSDSGPPSPQYFPPFFENVTASGKEHLYGGQVSAYGDDDMLHRDSTWGEHDWNAN